MKLRVTIDTDECNLDGVEPHVIQIDYEGVATMWYGSHNYFVPFNDVEIIECNHRCGTRKIREHDAEYGEEYDECHNCGKNMSEVIVNE